MTRPVAHQFKRFTIYVLMDDGTEHEVPLTNSARDAWDVVAAKHNYGDARPTLRAAFWAWHTLTKRGEISTKFETWHDQVAEIDVERAQPVDPTQPAAGTD